MNTQPSRAVPVGEQATALRLAKRLAAHPPLQQRVAAILDIVERDLQSGFTADQAEARVRDLTRALARDALQGWADHAAAQATERARREQPQAIRHTKKKSAGAPPSA